MNYSTNTTLAGKVENQIKTGEHAIRQYLLNNQFY